MEYLAFSADRKPVPTPAPDTLPADGFLWLDILTSENGSWPEEVARLTGVRIDDLHLDDARNPAHPSYYDSTRDYDMIVFRGLAPDTPAPRIVSHPVVFFLFDRLLVTVRPPDVKAFQLVRRRAFEGGGRPARSPVDLMLRLLNSMIDIYLDLRAPLTKLLEGWQRQLLDTRRPFHHWNALFEARVELRKLEDLCEEQRDALQEWRDERTDELTDAMAVRSADLVEHIQRVLGHARRLENAAESAVQLHFSALAFRTNETMRVLTAIAAIFLPMSLITGIFGMNFDAIPGLHNPSGFWLTVALMAAVGAGLFLYFRKKRLLPPDRT